MSETRPTTARDKLRVYFTIDTETSMGGAWRNDAWSPLTVDGPVFGRIDSKEYGIPLIMDVLEEYGFRGTFFTEVFCSYVLGDAAVAGVFEALLKRGHDVQLHLHPVYRFYRDYRAGGPRKIIDLIFQLPEEEQTTLIAEAADLFHRFCGTRPRAYRAGCYGASEATLRALRKAGIEIDSSYNLAQIGGTCGFETRPLNSPAMLCGVYEFPVTVFRVPGVKRYKELEVHAVSVDETLATLRAMRDGGCRDVVLSLHSFSFLKNTGVRYEKMRPDSIVIRRFRSLCQAIARTPAEFEVPVLGLLDLRSIPVPQPCVVPSAGWFHPVLRKVVQGVNRIPWV